jgi:hypothetical protein
MNSFSETCDVCEQNHSGICRCGGVGPGGCGTSIGDRLPLGALLGAVGGAVIGGMAGNAGTGAAIGAGVGTVAGAATDSCDVKLGDPE